jgi:hypothetical protein
MRKWLVVLAILMILWMSLPVHAQSTQSGQRLSSVSVDIKPEYDQPAVLVIYRITLSPETTLPATLNLRIPAGDEVSAVAVADPAKGLLNARYESNVQGLWNNLKITTNYPQVQVEYYDALDKTGFSRHIVYEWAGDYAVDGFTVTLEQPIGATNLVTNPALTQSNVTQGGFVYFESMTQSMAAGQSYTLTIDYQKATDTLSTTGLPVLPAQPLTAATPGRVTVNGVLPWVLAGIGAALIVIGIVGGVYMWKNGNLRPQTSLKHHSQPHPENDGSVVYCPRCGKRAQPGDVFCRTCGTRLHREE